MNEELKHHGVLGMKWGKRKDRRSGSVNKRREKTDAEKQATREKIKKGAKIAAKSLKIIGGLAVTGLVLKKSYDFVMGIDNLLNGVGDLVETVNDKTGDPAFAYDKWFFR